MESHTTGGAVVSSKQGRDGENREKTQKHGAQASKRDGFWRRKEKLLQSVMEASRSFMSLLGIKEHGMQEKN